MKNVSCYVLGFCQQYKYPSQQNVHFTYDDSYFIIGNWHRGGVMVQRVERWTCALVQTVSPQVTVSHPPVGRLPLLFARPAVTFPATEHHRPLTGTKLYCLVTEAHRCELLAQGCYAGFCPE